jgi:outer membrane protein OmpA-like peptidoglycan-associated protein
VSRSGRRRRLLTAAAGAFLLHAPVVLEGQGIAIGLAPEGGTYRWPTALGVEDDVLFLGGRATLEFGRFVALGMGYRRANSLGVSFDRSDYLDAAGEPVAALPMDVAFYSTDLRLRLWDGAIAPLLRSSGGVLAVTPAGRPTSQQMFLGLGGGIAIRLAPWLEGQVGAQDVRYRLNRALLADGLEGEQVPEDPRAGELWRNLHLSVSLGARVGGIRPSVRAAEVDQSFSDLLSGRTDGVAVPVQLFTGAIRFADDYLLRDRSQFGVRTGLDLGPYFGLRGSYWRGGSSGFDELQGIHGWSGEGHFSVGRMSRAAPFLALGFGQIRFAEDFRNDLDQPLENQATLVLGAGLNLPLGSRAGVSFSVRNYLTASGPPGEVAAPADLRHNPALELGLAYRLFGQRTPELPPVAVPPVAVDPVPPSPDRLIDGTLVDPREPVPFDSIRGYQSDRFVAIPIPTVGELTIRYGPPDPAAPRPAVAADPQTVPAPVGAAAIGPAEMIELEERISRRLEAMLQAQASVAAQQITDAEIARLQQQIRDLTALVADVMAQQLQAARLQPTQVTVLPSGTVVATGAPASALSGDPFLRGIEARIGPAMVRNGGVGPAISGEVSMGGFGWWGIRPFVGLHASRVGVARTFAGSSVIGSVTNAGASVGSYLDLPPIGPVAPSVSVMLTGSGGGRSGRTSQDSELMEQLYGGFAMGPALAGGVAYQHAPLDNLLWTGVIKRSWTGARSQWGLEFGARFVPPRAATPFGRIEIGLPPPVAAPIDAVPGPAADPPDVAAPLPAEDPVAEPIAELLRRLAELEETMLQDARARQEQVAAPEPEPGPTAAELRAAVRRDVESVAADFPDFMGVYDTERGIEVVLAGTMFGVGAADVGVRASSALARLARVLLSTDAPLLVEGHTDSTGSAVANQLLSEERARSVRNTLITQGIDPQRVTAVGSGQTRPQGDNATPAGRAANRRVEIVVRIP